LEIEDTDNFGIGLKGSVDMLGHILAWRKNGTGMLSTPFAEGAGFFKSDPTQNIADLQLHFVISIVDDHARKLHPGYGFSCHLCVLRPYSEARFSYSRPTL
jgi:choline dehydrogenase-like flavoprotein